MAFLQETEHAHNRKASDSYALPPTHHAWFYFLNASNKTKLHIGYSWFAYTIYASPQWFWLMQLLEIGRSRSADSERFSSFSVLFSSSEPPCHYTCSRQHNQELKIILYVPPSIKFIIFNINISWLSKFKWLFQLRNSWSSMFWTQSYSVQISL